MKIAVEVSIFGRVFSEVVDYPGVPGSQTEVVQWLMNQTDYRWTDYDSASAEDKAIYHLQSILRQ